MPLRFVAYTRVGMQRAGLLVASCVAAEDRRPADVERIAAQISRYVQRTVTVPPKLRGATQTYLNSLRLWKRYGPLRGRPLSDSDLIEVQDLWLSDPGVPSATGALTPENATEMPQLAISLRLLRDGTLTRTDRGRALVLSSGEGKVAALRDGEPEPNPFVLTIGAQLLILSALIEADGDFLQSLWRTSRALNGSVFTRPDFTQDLAAACADLRVRGRARARTGADQQLLRRLAEWEEAVRQERKSGSDWGGGRPPDQMATLRLEPFVDVGMIDRVDRYAYRYRLNEGQVRFWRLVAEGEDPGSIIRRGLVAGWMAATGHEAAPATEQEIWSAIRYAYGDLRSSLGFASFAEVVLVAVGRLLAEEIPRWFELQDGIDVLNERRRLSPREVRLGLNRGGELTYMKLTEPARTR